MQPTASYTLDPMSTLERVDTFLGHVERLHSAGLAWGGLAVCVEHVAGAGAVDPDAVLGAPRPTDRAAMVADLHSARRLLAVVAAHLRFAETDRRLAESVADGLCLARGAPSVHGMRQRLHHEVRLRLRHLKRETVRRIDATGSVDIRLDAWGTVGDVEQSGVRRYLEDVLAQQADYTTFGRSSLGRLVDTRRQLADALFRLDALALGDRSPPPPRRADSGPLTLARITRPTPPVTPAESAPSPQVTG